MEKFYEVEGEKVYYGENIQSMEGIVCSSCGNTHWRQETMYFNDGSLPFHFSAACSECSVGYNPRYDSRPTQRAVDEGDSVPLQAESTPKHLPIEKAETTPALRN